jgi:hypothetical protein
MASTFLLGGPYGEFYRANPGDLIEWKKIGYTVHRVENNSGGQLELFSTLYYKNGIKKFSIGPYMLVEI